MGILNNSTLQQPLPYLRHISTRAQYAAFFKTLNLPITATKGQVRRRMGQLTAQYEDRLVTAERDQVKKQRTKNQMERLVEDLIQEGMAKGAFDNLAGAGKPLPE